MIKVSVVISAYNVEDYIERCLKSILNQSLTNIEIIVVNDGSVDNTLKIIKSVVDRDKRVVIIDKENEGVMETRRVGFNTAQGEYVLFVDGDDWLEIKSLEKLYYTAKEHECDMVLFNAFWSYDNTREGKVMVDLDKISKDDLLKGLLLTKLAPAMWNKFVRRSFIIENNIEFPKNISYAEDLATVSVWFMYNPNVVYLEEYLYNYYQRQDSITKINTSKILEVDRARDFIKEQLIKNELFEKYENEFQYLEYKQLFIYRFLGNNMFYLKAKDVYDGFKSKEIEVFKNPYIKREIQKYPIGFKIRVLVYNYNYYLGKIYDVIRSITGR